MLPAWRSATACAAVTGTLVVAGVAATGPPAPAPALPGDRPAAASAPLPAAGTDAALGRLVAVAADRLAGGVVGRLADHLVVQRPLPPRTSAVRAGTLLHRAPRPAGSRPADSRSSAGRVSAASAPARAAVVEPLTVTVASFNVLGSQHTAAGGTKPWYAAGVVRAGWARQLMEERGYDVVGLQESQPDQVRVLRATGTWSSYPDPSSARLPGLAQSILWREDTWTLVTARSFPVPFLGSPRPQPAVLLEHRVTGRQVWFVNVHLTPRRDRRDGERERDLGTAALAAQVRLLRASGQPVVVTGDLNEHADVFCRLTATAGLVAASGGSAAGRCLPPRVMRVDWIFGTPDVQWSDFRFAADPAVRRITDHSVPVVRATLP